VKPSPYQGYNPLDECDHWEDRTRVVVLNRLRRVPPIRFLSRHEARTLDAVVDRLLPQDDRPVSDRVPITPFIDEALFEDDTDGFRKAGMPWEQEAWKLGLAGIDEASRERFHADFTSLRAEQQDQMLSLLQRGEVAGGSWRALPAKEFFAKVVQQVLAVYYAHPTAWAEIGWPGPASRRGYMRTGYGRFDPWQPRPAGEASSVTLVRGNVGGSGSAAGGTGGATH
jgi:hypothetical protein